MLCPGCQPQEDIDDAFPDDPSSAMSDDSFQKKGPALNGVRLAEMEALGSDNLSAADTHIATPASTPQPTGTCLSQL